MLKPSVKDLRCVQQIFMSGVQFQRLAGLYGEWRWLRWSSTSLIVSFYPKFGMCCYIKHIPANRNQTSRDSDILTLLPNDSASADGRDELVAGKEMGMWDELAMGA